MKNTYVDPLIEYGHKINADIKEELGVLSPEQFNWKPAPDSWSAGQCVDHLKTTLAQYEPIFAALLEDRKPSNFWEKVPFLPGMWGGMLKSFTQPDIKRKIKTVPVFEPTKSEVLLSVIDAFIERQQGLFNSMRQLDGLDHAKTIVTSPASQFITYSLKDAFAILCMHPERHLNQARNVLKMSAFPQQEQV
ncbi:MAG: DinB family protein [Bacteroidota bacterium]